MQKSRSLVIGFGLTIVGACTVPDASVEVETFAKSTGTLVGTVSTQFDARIAAEAAQRRRNAIQAGKLIYGLTPGCDAILNDIGGAEVIDTSFQATNCAVIHRLDQDRALTQSELAKKLAGVIADYGSALESLAKSELPSEIEASSALLFTNISNLAAAAGGDASRLTEAAPFLSRGIGFVSTRAKARILKRAISQADQPLQASVSSLIAVLVAQGKDPLFPAITALQSAEKQMRDARGSSQYGVKVRAFEKAEKAYRKAYLSSPSVSLDQVRKTHASLVARLQSGATLEEIQTLLDELKALRDLIK